MFPALPDNRVFLFPDSAIVGEEQPGREQVFPKLRQSTSNRERESLEPEAIERKEWRLGQTIPEKQVHQVVPKYLEHKEQQRKDLRKIGCKEFLNLPWDILDESVLLELDGGKVVAEFRNLELQGRPKNWKVEHWRAIYRIPNSPFG